VITALSSNDRDGIPTTSRINRPSLVVSAQSGATRRNDARVLRRSSGRVAFDWATRRKPLAGRTLWMREPTLVLREGRVDLKEKPEGGRLRVGARSLMRLYSGPNGSSTPVFAGGAHSRVGVQLHVGAPTWSADYELSKNWHRLASSRAVRLAPICIAAPHLGQFQLAAEVAAASGHTC
jgi:hypothetical protein